MTCDDRVVTLVEGSANDYSSGLIKVVQYQKQNASGRVIGEALSLSERESEIGGRIRRILDPVNQRRMARLTFPSILILFLISCIVMPGKSGWQTVPDHPGLYSSDKSGKTVQMAQFKMGDIKSQKDIMACIQNRTLQAVTPDVHFLLYAPGTSIEDVRHGLRMGIFFIILQSCPHRWLSWSSNPAHIKRQGSLGTYLPAAFFDEVVLARYLVESPKCFRSQHVQGYGLGQRIGPREGCLSLIPL